MKESVMYRILHTSHPPGAIYMRYVADLTRTGSSSYPNSPKQFITHGLSIDVFEISDHTHHE
jgi:hypothetical protein